MMRRLAGVALLLTAALANAQPYPSRPVRVLIAFAGGGLADLIARALTDRMSPALGQPFVLENRPGAGGNIAMEAVVRGPHDGHTLLMIGPAAAINGALYRNLSFSPAKDLAPIGVMGWGPYAMFVSSTVPVTSAAELVAYAKANPGKLNYASVGVGSGGHLTGVLFAMAAGVQMTHVPYKGIQAIAPDIVSGEVHVVFNAFGPLNAFVQAGKVKLLAVTSAERLPAYPEVPSLSESALPGFDATGWYVLFAPAGTPRPVLERLNAELRSALADRDTVQKIEKAGMRPVAQTLDEAARFMTAETDKWGRAVRASSAAAE
jgi:tripartite-type tricarboxylate transporter receptor subunit TctC